MFVALLTAARQIDFADSAWLELSRYLPYPIMLIPAGLAVVLSARLGRRWVLISVATLTLVATVGMGLEWHARSIRGGQLRVMTYNVKSMKALERADGVTQLAREIALHDPDILVMQDASGVSTRRTAGAASAPAVFGLSHVFAIDQFVVASRFPLRHCAPGPGAPLSHATFYVSCLIDVGGTDLTLVTAHFESPREGLNATRREGLDGLEEWQQNFDSRLLQARTLASELESVRGPLILAGDLNAPEASPVIRSLLATGLRDAFSSNGQGYGYSYGHALRAGFSFLRIDHVLVSADIGIADCFAGNAQASDHRPVIADVFLGRNWKVP